MGKKQKTCSNFKKPKNRLAKSIMANVLYSDKDMNRPAHSIGGEKVNLTYAQQEVIKKRFAAFCVKVLKNEATDYFRGLQRRKKHERSMTGLSRQEMEKLSMVDVYPSHAHVFNVMDYDVEIGNGPLADLLETMPQNHRNILLLYYCIGMTDKEICEMLGMNRSTIQYQRMASLNRMRKAMEGGANEKTE